MPLDTRKLAGKVAYCRSKMTDETGRLSPAAVAISVWWSFYRGVRFEGAEDGTVTGNVRDLIELPSVREVRAVMRRADRPPKPAPADPEPPVPYYNR